MIDFIKGTVVRSEGNCIAVDIGVLGLELQCAHASTFAAGSAIQLYTYLHWNQENGPSLFGFSSILDKQVFLMIIDCSGIGPKLGIAALSHLGAQQFLNAIQMGNDGALSKVPGIGQKKAEQLIMQLRDKVAKLIKSGVDLGQNQEMEQWTTVSQTLTSLNYSRGEIALAMKHLGDTFAGKPAPFDLLMRQALSYLAKKPTL